MATTPAHTGNKGLGIASPESPRIPRIHTNSLRIHDPDNSFESNYSGPPATLDENSDAKARYIRPARFAAHSKRVGLSESVRIFA